MSSGTGILPVCKSEDDGLEARPTKNEEHSFDPSDRTYTVLSVWIIPTDGEIPYLVTAYIE